MTPSGLAALARYDWPGNVRELRNILERALILSDSGRLTGDDFARISAVRLRSPGPRRRRGRRAPSFPMRRPKRSSRSGRWNARLQAANGQISEAARMLRISRATFYKKLAKFGLAPSGSSPV